MWLWKWMANLSLITFKPISMRQWISPSSIIEIRPNRYTLTISPTWSTLSRNIWSMSSEQKRYSTPTAWMPTVHNISLRHPVRGNCKAQIIHQQVVLATVPDNHFGAGFGSTRTFPKLAVRVVNKPETSTWVWFNGQLPTRPNWAGCQRVAQRVHL